MESKIKELSSEIFRIRNEIESREKEREGLVMS